MSETVFLTLFVIAIVIVTPFAQKKGEHRSFRARAKDLAAALVGLALFAGLIGVAYVVLHFIVRYW